MPILLIVLFAAAIDKAVIFTDVNFCLFNEFEVPVSQPNFKIVKERRVNSTKPISAEQMVKAFWRILYKIQLSFSLITLIVSRERFSFYHLPLFFPNIYFIA